MALLREEAGERGRPRVAAEEGGLGDEAAPEIARGSAAEEGGHVDLHEDQTDEIVREHVDLRFHRRRHGSIFCLIVFQHRRPATICDLIKDRWIRYLAAIS